MFSRENIIMSTEAELHRALAELAKLTDERRVADDQWRAGVDAANASQSQSLSRIETSVIATRTDIGNINARLADGDVRMTKQDEWHAKHDAADETQFTKIEKRLDKLEAYTRLQKKIINWFVGVLTALGLGWIAVKLGWK